MQGSLRSAQGMECLQLQEVAWVASQLVPPRLGFLDSFGGACHLCEPQVPVNYSPLLR